MAEDLNAADHLNGDFGVYPTRFQMPAQTGIQKMAMIDLAYEHVTDTVFFNNF
jgi:hypothetical protein